MSAGGFPVIELRRYVTTEGAREEFATYFDTYFPEAFQQLGAIVFGQFRERGNVDGFAWLAEASFTGYRRAGVREAGVLVTLDVPNNYPPLPVRTDGPHLVWLGIVKDDEVLRTLFEPAAERAAQALVRTGVLRAEPELLVLDPTPRSRLRWLP